MPSIEPVIWPTDNIYGIPHLDLEQQASEIIQPFTIWGSVPRGTQMPGTWGFYTQDYRFTALWSDPRPVVRSGCKVAIEPNFSCYEDMPLAVGLWRIYQKRWLARWWQQQGIQVIADLNVAPKFASYNMMGIPQGWRAYATRGYLARIEQTKREYEMACNRAQTNKILFLVYGGSKKLRDLCWFLGWQWIGERADAVKAQRKAVAA